MAIRTVRNRPHSRECQRQRDGGLPGRRHRRLRHGLCWFFSTRPASLSLRRCMAPAGGVTGRTTFATLVWLIGWGAAALRSGRAREMAPGRVFALTLLLVGVGCPRDISAAVGLAVIATEGRVPMAVPLTPRRRAVGKSRMTSSPVVECAVSVWAS